MVANGGGCKKEKLKLSSRGKCRSLSASYSQLKWKVGGERWVVIDVKVDTP
jgi:hypothetical protein